MEMLLSLWKKLFNCPLAFYETPPGGGDQPPAPIPVVVAGQDPPPGGDIPVIPDPPIEPVPPAPAEPDYEEKLSGMKDERGAKGIILEMDRKTEDLTKAHDKIKELEGNIQKNKPLVHAGEQRTIAKDRIDAYRKKMEDMGVDERYIAANIELASNLSQGFTPEETDRIRKNVYGGDLDETINKLKSNPNFKAHITRLEPEFRKLALTVSPQYWKRPEIMCKYLGELNMRNPIKGKPGASINDTPPVEPYGTVGGGGKGAGVTDAEVRTYAEANSMEIPSQAVFEKIKKSMITERNAEKNRLDYEENRNKK